jgi:tight adherence protein C
LPLDWMAFAATLGFTISVGAALAMIYTVVATERGAIVQLRRRLAPSEDLPDLVEHKAAISELVAHGLTPLAKLAKPRGDDQQQLLRGRLVNAGFRSGSVAQIFLASKVMCALILGVAVLLANALRVDPIPHASASALLLAGFGLFLPNLWLSARVRKRQLAIARGLPDALDLLVTCVEAGLGLDAALQRVAAEIVLSHPVLAEELTLTFLETKAGVARTDAMRRLGERTGVQDLKTLAATLNQTELFGTSIATALRVQAEGMRIHRTQDAERRAAVLSVKMTFPLVVCFMPALFVVLLGPAIVNLIVGFVRGG